MPRLLPLPLALGVLVGLVLLTVLYLYVWRALRRKAAGAVENARLFEERGRHTQRLLALNEVSRSLTGILDPREIFPTIVRLAADLMEASVVRLWLYDAARGALVVGAAGGTDAEAAAAGTSYTAIAPGQGLVGAIFARREAEFIDDLRLDPRWLNRELTDRFGVTVFAGVPLVLKDEGVGVLAVMSRGPRRFSPGERDLMEAFASQAALAIHNARLFETTERNLSETRALLSVVESITGSHDLGEVMRRISREAARALGADSATFYVIDEAIGRVVPMAGYHIPKALLERAVPLTREAVPAVLSEAFRTREMVFARDVSTDPRFQSAAFQGVPVRSLLASPVHAKGQVFGSLLLYWWDRVRDLSENELALMAALSGEAALALENARLLAETQAQAVALKEKNAELNSFVYTVSHDLKAPLVTIQGMASVLAEDHAAALDEQGRHYVRRIQANTQQMERLLLDLLALSRIGREARAPEAVSLADLVDEILGELAEPLRTRGIKASVGDLGTLTGIRVQLEQVFRNLLSNAVKYIGDGPEPLIEVGMETRDEVAECWVKDTGIGIAPEYHDKVFEIFQRLKEVEAEGTGVGLAIVKKIVEAGGGRVWVESTRGAGTTFRFTWPLGPRR